MWQATDFRFAPKAASEERGRSLPLAGAAAGPNGFGFRARGVFCFVFWPGPGGRMSAEHPALLPRPCEGRARLGIGRVRISRSCRPCNFGEEPVHGKAWMSVPRGRRTHSGLDSSCRDQNRLVRLARLVDPGLSTGEVQLRAMQSCARLALERPEFPASEAHTANWAASGLTRLRAARRGARLLARTLAT